MTVETIIIIGALLVLVSVMSNLVRYDAAKPTLSQQPVATIVEQKKRTPRKKK